MSQRRPGTPWQLLGLVSSLWLLLAGCGGPSGSGDHSGATLRVSRLALQITTSDRVVGAAQVRAVSAAQTRQVAPGEPGFITRLEITVRRPNDTLLLTQAFALTAADQESVTLPRPTDPPLAVDVENNSPIRIAIAAFNAANAEIFRTDPPVLVTVVTTQDPQVVPLTLARVLVPVLVTPATASTALQNRAFTFPEGSAFGVPGAAVTLAFGTFTQNTGGFALTAGALTARGDVTIRSCDFTVRASTFPAGQGPQVGQGIVIDPCQVDAVDNRLIARNVATGTTSTSNPLPPPPPPSVGNLPPVVTSPGNQRHAEGEVVSFAIIASDPNQNPLTFSATNLPPGLSVNATTGLISGTVNFTAVVGSPASDFSTTVTVSDGILSASVGFTWTVTNVNRPPTLTAPGNQTTLEGAPASLQMNASDPDNDPLTFSATGLPPGLSLNATTGLISGSVASGAAAGSPYSVTVTASDGVVSVSTSFAWTVPAPLTLSAIVPTRGFTSGGTAVTLTGTSFQTGASVTIGGTAATNVSVVSATQITATTPAGTAGAKDVVVTNPNGQSATLAGGFTYVAPAPTLSTIAPASGPTSGGTPVTLTGSNFQTGATVTIGGTAATNVSVVSATQITATTPAGTAGAADVVVTNPDGQSATLVRGFLYTSAFILDQSRLDDDTRRLQ